MQLLVFAALLFLTALSLTLFWPLSVVLEGVCQ